MELRSTKPKEVVWENKLAGERNERKEKKRGKVAVRAGMDGGQDRKHEKGRN